ncbi:MAG: SUF system Fe-S cluster assembly regulator [Steroidobacteraceae bacterium]
MLRISKLTDYATVLLAALSAQPQALHSASGLADRTGIGAATVSKLLKELHRAGLVSSTRGARGGYQLARPPAHISAAEIIDAVEGPVALTECAIHGGHCELVFEGLEIPAEYVLIGEGEGLRLTQTRLGPARLTHCMRWLGLAGRAVEIARAYAETRMGFGQRLAERESVRMMLGDLAMQIEVGRLLVMKAAWEIDRGGYAQKEVSMAKVHVANLLHKAADTAIQINGARGYSTDTVLEWIYRYARQARLVDGADEVHRMLLDRALKTEGAGFWRWPVAQEGGEAGGGDAA